jgi:hypothetical protein
MFVRCAYAVALANALTSSSLSTASACQCLAIRRRNFFSPLFFTRAAYHSQRRAFSAHSEKVSDIHFSNVSVPPTKVQRLERRIGPTPLSALGIAPIPRGSSLPAERCLGFTLSNPGDSGAHFSIPRHCTGGGRAPQIRKAWKCRT